MGKTKCPACSKTFNEGDAIHKLVCFDIEPTFGMGPRLWICEVTAKMYEDILEKFHAKTNPRDWFGPFPLNPEVLDLAPPKVKA